MRVVAADRALARFQSLLTSDSGEFDWDWQDPGDIRGLSIAMREADVFVGSHLPAAAVAEADRLGLVQTAGAGVDGIPFQALQPHVRVANVYEHEDSIAEYVLLAMLAISRDLLGVDRQLREGIWSNPAIDESLPLPRVLNGQHIALVGFGHIGKRVAELCQFLGMRVSAVRRHPGRGSEGIPLEFLGGSDDLSRLLSDADFVVVVAPLSNETTGLIGRAELAQLKPEAALINVARGPVVDEDALFEALEAKSFAGAVLDVWYQPPSSEGPQLPSTRPFHTLDNVVMTPHFSGVTEDTFRRRAVAIAANLRRFREGKELLNQVSVVGSDG